MMTGLLTLVTNTVLPRLLASGIFIVVNVVDRVGGDFRVECKGVVVGHVLSTNII